MTTSISIDRFKETINLGKTAFLCGNGFSINFDGDFGNIFERLFTAHKQLIHDSSYLLNGNSVFTKKCKKNFKNVKQQLRVASEDTLYKIFEDALIFADSVQTNQCLLDELLKNKLVNEMVFGNSQITILNQICKIGKKKGIRSVNIEYWPVLIHLYFAIKKINPSYYSFPNSNSFINIVKIGGSVKNRVANGEETLLEDILLNGFTVYYRLLFSIAIFSNGKAIDLSLLTKLKNLNIDGIKDFLQDFDTLITLNYDHILENITQREVIHLHGEFVKGKQEYLYYQSLGLNTNYGHISFSDILIGDYFALKNQFNIISTLNSMKTPTSKPVTYVSKKIEDIVSNNTDTFVLFGLSILNDQHILRTIMMSFYAENTKNPKLIYCYFTEEERDIFYEQYEKCITFSDRANEYVRNIEIEYIRTQEILDTHFHLVKSKNTPSIIYA
ncbi:hypothetical protein [Bacillus cereus]|uniref:hypothetical protein n=1 Tax=Bacillus cereus TaxID=1396 RepID=UPI000BF80B85|nr:hypothetical protein [Bacillus cereus]PEU03202.1 hypothetical protein CN534_05130 [Bacillus cereus]PEZ62104.1 hypothetical protein CN370_09485 [Bacillus cereus]PFB67172.1 hypothetical protein CN292_21315 [Bacillus cereus]